MSKGFKQVAKGDACTIGYNHEARESTRISVTQPLVRAYLGVAALENEQ